MKLSLLRNDTKQRGLKATLFCVNPHLMHNSVPGLWIPVFAGMTEETKNRVRYAACVDGCLLEQLFAQAVQTNARNGVPFADAHEETGVLGVTK